MIKSIMFVDRVDVICPEVETLGPDDCGDKYRKVRLSHSSIKILKDTRTRLIAIYAVLEHLRTALESPVFGCPDTGTSTICVLSPLRNSNTLGAPAHC